MAKRQKCPECKGKTQCDCHLCWGRGYLAPNGEGSRLQPAQPDDQYPGVPVQGWSPAKNSPRFEIVKHFARNDPKCLGDYCEVSVVVDGTTLHRFGDYYHDKGTVRAEAWLEGYMKGTNQSGVVSRRDVADSDLY